MKGLRSNSDATDAVPGVTFSVHNLQSGVVPSHIHAYVNKKS